MTAARLEHAVLALPADERTRLVERIIESLESAAHLDRVWHRVTERRDQVPAMGAGGAIPVEEALASAQEQARLAHYFVHPEALDHFIEAWRASRSDEQIAARGGPYRKLFLGVLRRLRLR